MTSFDQPQNFMPNPESLLRRVRPRVIPPQISLSAAEPVIQALSASQAMAQKTLRDYSVPSANQVPPGLRSTRENFEIKDGSHYESAGQLKYKVLTGPVDFSHCIYHFQFLSAGGIPPRIFQLYISRLVAHQHLDFRLSACKSFPSHRHHGPDYIYLCILEQACHRRLGYLGKLLYFQRNREGAYK